MINELSFRIHDSIGCESIKYSAGVKLVEYDAVHKKLKVLLEPGYVCEDKEKLQTFNVSCEPYHHAFYCVEYININ